MYYTCTCTCTCIFTVGPLKEGDGEGRAEFHYNAANRMIASAMPIQTNEVAHVTIM